MNPLMNIKKPVSLEQARAKNANREAITGFYNLLEDTRAMNSIGPHKPWNVDEKGLTPDPLPRAVVAGHISSAQQQHTKSHDHMSANVCIDVCGSNLPPQLIFNRKQLAVSLVTNRPPGALCRTSSKGSMDQELFLSRGSRNFLGKYASELSTTTRHEQSQQSHKLGNN